MHDLTIYETGAVAVYEEQSAIVEMISIPNAASLHELFERVGNASASSADVRLLKKHVGQHLTAQERAFVDYAEARAIYREGRPVSISQLMLLGSMTEKQIGQHMKMLAIAPSEMISNEHATRIMFRSTVEI